MGNSEGKLGSPRHPRRRRRLRPPLDGAHRVARQEAARLGWSSASSKFHDWQSATARPNEHNGHVPRDGWLEDWEKQAILDYHGRASAGRLSPAGVHDARRRRGGGQPVERLSGAQAGRPAGPQVAKTFEKRERVSCNRCEPTSTGTSTCRTSTWAARFTTCARCSTATAAPSSTGRSARA